MLMMTKTVFQEIQNDFEVREAAIQLQLNLLSKAVGKMAAGFGNYLGLPAPRWNHLDGKAGDFYIRLGEGSANSFKEKPWMQLSSLGGVVSFSLAVTVDSEDREIRTTYVFDMKVRFCGDGYQFDLNDNVHQILSVDEVQGGVFDPVYSMIVTQLKALLDPSKIFIKN
jgi:hypothetical protein